MGNRILEIVVYLMDHMWENQGRLPSVDDLSPDLKNRGYSESEITSAYSWVMDRYESAHETYYSRFPQTHSSNRILTAEERSRFSTEAFGFLIRLLNLRLIDDEQLESIIERGVLFGPETVDVDQAKLIVSAVVFEEFGEVESHRLFEPHTDPSSKTN